MEGLGFRLEYTVSGFGFRVSGFDSHSRLRVSGIRFGVLGSGERFAREAAQEFCFRNVI
jgi:hypothetical protein